MNDTYKYYACKENDNVQIIELPSKALGGVEALDFSLLCDKLFNDGAKTIIIDLEKVEVMNSSGLGMLVGALSKAKKINVSFALASAPDKILNLLKMTRLDGVFQLFDNIATAVEKLK
jgi:anti-sigma B factor antagonist